MTDRVKLDARWRELIALYQRGESAGASLEERRAGWLATEQLLPSVEGLGRAVCHKYRLAQKLGAYAAEDVIGEGVLRIFIYWRHMESPPDKPIAHSAQRFDWLALSALDKGKRTPTAHARTGRQGETRGPLEVVEAPRRRDPLALPREVCRTYVDAAKFGGVAWRLRDLAGISWPSDASFDTTRARFSRQLRKWEQLAEYLEGDIAFGPARPRWAHPSRHLPSDVVKVPNNMQRAWQADFHTAEENEAYTSPDEIPKDKHSKEGDLFYQHTQRFRKAYADARKSGSASFAHFELAREAGVTEVAVPPVRVWTSGLHITLLSSERSDETSGGAY